VWVRDFYEEVEKYGPGSNVLLIQYQGPDMIGDSYPNALLILQYAKMKEWDLIIYSQTAPADLIIKQIFTALYGTDWNNPNTGYGTDWIYLGMLPGEMAMVRTQCEQGLRAYRSFDNFGTPLDDLPVANGFESAEDWDIVVGLGCYAAYIAMPVTKIQYGIPFVLVDIQGAASMFASDYLAGNIEGFMHGVKGAAEFETLTGLDGGALKYISSNIAISIFAMFGIIYSNIYYLILKPSAIAERGTPKRMEEAG
jgi:hypothetical protein